MLESNDRSNSDRDRDRDQSARSSTGGPNASLILFVLLVAGAIAFFLQNSESATITFLFFDKDTSVRWAIIIAVVVGILLDRLISFWWNRRQRRR